jgi:single-strand DNA-binding protein
VSRGSRPSETEHAAEPDWFRIIAWEKLAELCNQLLHKGSRVYHEGRLQTRTWRDDQGQDHAVTEVDAGELLLLDSRPASEAPAVPGPPADDDLPF